MTQPSSSFVCAFRGRRDAYEVPLALAEAGRLDQFITDAWAGPLLRRLPLAPRFAGRWKAGIPDEKVRSLWSTTLREHWFHARGISPTETWTQLDADFSRAAMERARLTGSDLLLYSPYAWEAFTASYPRRSPRRILFQYHPHPSVEARILDDDLQGHPEIRQSHAEATGVSLAPDQQRRNHDPWRHADLIVCASAFTRDTLLEVGADPAKCAVVPYGVEIPLQDPSTRANDGAFRVLFAGSGVQRKGLHHLLAAWQSARLPASSELTLVCRVMDPGLEEQIAGAPGVRLLRRVTDAELSQLYRESTLLAMPSLVEGFGQVYLEALAAGCPVLGTRHTCLPDLGDESDGVFLTPPADVAGLRARLEAAAATLPGQPDLRERARACAQQFTWAKFRAAISALL